MGLYNFQKRFVPFILDGRKTHTIRALRAHPDVKGSTLHLYTGLRQKGARLLMRVPCTRVEEILIDSSLQIVVDGVVLDRSECDQLARRDGFLDYIDMMLYWQKNVPFHGQIIHWNFIRSRAAQETTNDGKAVSATRL